MMKMILIAVLALVLVSGLATAFPVETASYSVVKTVTGLAGSEVETFSFDGRVTWDPWSPYQTGETAFYWLSPGYYEVIFGQDALEVVITLLSPPNAAVLSDVNISFSHSSFSNETIDSCRLLIYADAVLTLNLTEATGPGAYNWSGQPLAEDDYTWKVGCNNSLGVWYYSGSIDLIVDRTAPVIVVDVPPPGTTVPSNATFEINIDELNPSYLLIDVGGTLYNYTYNSGDNVFNIMILEGVYNWSVTAFDDAGNNASLGPYPLIVNDAEVSITNLKFSPSPPKTGLDNTLSALIGGDVVDVTIGIDIDGVGWTNYTVNSFTGTGPFTYYYVLNSSEFVLGDVISQQWFVLDGNSIITESVVLSATVQKTSSGGGGGGWPDDDVDSGLGGKLVITPNPLQVRTLDGILFTVKNNGTGTCTLKSVAVEDRLGSNDLQDRFSVKTLSLEDDSFKIDPGKSVSLLLKPTGLQGVAGNGVVIVTSENCGEATVNLGVELHFTDVVIDKINEWTDNIVTWFEGVLG